MKNPKPPAKPHAGAQPVDEAYSEEEAERRRYATLKRMLEMPPKPHKPVDKRESSRQDNRGEE